jgi:hypothetical protein
MENVRKEFVVMENARESSFFFADLIKPFSIRQSSWRMENMRKEFMRTWRMCKEALAYSPNTSRDTKLSRARLIIVQNEIFLDPFFLYKMGWIKPKNHLTQLSL